MHVPALIADLAILLGLAGIVSLLFQRLKQPVVLGYLLAGIIAGPYTPPASFVVDLAGIHVWAELGVIFLMFGLGLEFSFSKLLKVGRTAAIAGPFEAFVMMAVGFAAGQIAGWNVIDSFFLGGILSISSTTIIIKSLEELKLKREHFAELIFGILIVEDLAGILILTFLATLSGGASISVGMIAWSTAKLLLIVAAWIVIGSLLVPRFIDYIAKRTSDETLLVVSLGLCLGLVMLSAYFHYSVALGAFVMGAIIGGSQVAHRIEKLVTPLRDVFGAIFFVSTGMLLNPGEAVQHWPIILLATALTIFGKIAVTTAGVRLSGQDWRTATRVGLGLAQIGEFSFIIASLGVSSGTMSPFLYSVAVTVSVVTTFTTPYLLRLARR